MARLHKRSPLDNYNDVHNITTPMRRIAYAKGTIQFALPVILHEYRLEYVEPFYCPNGHKITVEELEDKSDLAEQNEPLKNENLVLLHRLEQAEAKARDRRGVSTDHERTDGPDATRNPNTSVTDDAVFSHPYCDQKMKSKRGPIHHGRSVHRDELEVGS